MFTKLLVIAFLSLSPTAALAKSFVCRLEDKTDLVVSVKTSDTAASVVIADHSRFLEIRELNPRESFEMERLKRVKEAKYSFEKFYSDFNAWQDISISLPKKVSTVGKYVTGYLTIYQDNGDAMVPGPSHKMDCRLTSN